MSATPSTAPQPPTRPHIVLGTFIEGIAAGHWRDPRFRSDGNSSIESFIEFATIAERGTFDVGFIADTSFINEQAAWHTLSRLEPVTALAALATRTQHLGLIGTVSTSFTQPFDVARQIASLDRISKGRGGWNVVTSYLDGHAANYGAEHMPEKAERYRIASEFVEVVKGLWQSWRPESFPRDRESGVYVDWSTARPVHHSGTYFSVRGPLNVERSEQGEPVIFQAGSSPEGIEFGARFADATFVIALDTLEKAQARYAQLKQAATDAGRDPDGFLVLQALNPIVGETTEEAWEHYYERVEYIEIDHALGVCARYFQYFDFSTIDLDAPFPEGFIEHASEGFTTYAEEILRDAQENGLTVREAVLRHVWPNQSFVGSADDIADKIATYFTERALDGVVLTVDTASLNRFVDLVVPRLRAKGLFREEYAENSTLRSNLRLPVPPSRTS